MILPCIECLILTHILQTEVKSKMSALKKRLQAEPAFPDGSPSRRTIMAASQIATQARHLRPEGAQGHGGRLAARALGQHRKRQRLNHLVSRAFWFFTSIGTQLQQSYSKRRQQTQQADQAINALQLPFLDATPAFETLVIVLDQPALAIPVHALPRLFEGRGGHRGQHDPFQRFLSFRSLLFPDANDPNGQGFLARSRLTARWQEGHLAEG